VENVVQVNVLYLNYTRPQFSTTEKDNVRVIPREDCQLQRQGYGSHMAMRGRKWPQISTISVAIQQLEGLEILDNVNRYNPDTVWVTSRHIEHFEVSASDDSSGNEDRS
jgi:hypothetical protein